MNAEFSQERTGTGTQEWADINYNIARGCPHNCLYCYARANALRFKQINSREEWNTETINFKAVNKKWGKRNGVIMFPTTHDITPTNLDACITALKNILTPGNKVLIVSKPHIECVQRLCEELGPWKDQILFRFTIGSFNEGICSFWEPGAPSPAERFHALKYAFEQGFQTSVSIEPMLEGRHEATVTFEMVKKYITDTVWIGKMNKMRNRVDMSNPNNQFMVEDVERLQIDKEILQLVERLKFEPKVRWKDSIKTVIQRNAQGEE